MTGLAIAVAVWLFLMLTVWAICTMSKRADERDEARRRHPANYDLSTWKLPPPLGTEIKMPAAAFSDDTEAAIEAAVSLLDDGKALVAETEDYLRRLSK